jgi:hypothetical protein
VTLHGLLIPLTSRSSLRSAFGLDALLRNQVATVVGLLKASARRVGQ